MLKILLLLRNADDVAARLAVRRGVSVPAITDY